MGIYRRCGRCGKRIQSGTRCDCLKQRHKEYDMYLRDRQSYDYYHSKEWELKRQTILDLDDETDVYIYMTTGEVVLANTVHHIMPLKDDWSKRFDDNNLMSLNHDTHSIIERKYKENKQTMIQLLEKMLREYRELKNN